MIGIMVDFRVLFCVVGGLGFLVIDMRDGKWKRILLGVWVGSGEDFYFKVFVRFIRRGIWWMLRYRSLEFEGEVWIRDYVYRVL